jgi:hypothetical protein
MGPEFYHHVFSPAVAHAITEHRSYEVIRDTLRASWNEARAA